MKIALVTPYFPDIETIDSGIANHCLSLATGLAALGNHVMVFHIRPCYKNESDFEDEQILSPGITVITHRIKAPIALTKFFKHKWALIDFTIKLKCMVAAAKVLKTAIKKHEVQVIETSSYFSLCYFLEQKSTAPIAVRVSTTFSQIMNDHYPFKSRGMNLIAKMELTFIKKSRHLVTHSRNHAQELERLYSIHQDNFEIIPHGIELPSASSIEQKNHNKSITILYTGRFEYRKGTDILLEAIPLVLQRNPNVVFKLIGDDANNEYQQRFLAKNTFGSNQVIFQGKVDEYLLKQAYRDCDIFVAPSRYESFGLIFIEAMSYGKPVIGCNVGGVPEIIKDNFNGLFANTGDSVSLADKITILIENADLREKLALNALQTVKDRFTIDQLAKNSLVYYQKIISAA